MHYTPLSCGQIHVGQTHLIDPLFGFYSERMKYIFDPYKYINFFILILLNFLLDFKSLIAFIFLNEIVEKV